MPAPLDQDLRERLLDAFVGGASRQEAARRFAVSYSTAVRWVAAWLQEGRRTPLSMGGDRHGGFDQHRSTIQAIVDEQPDRTLVEIREELADRKVPLGHASVCRWLARAGLSFKKKTLLACEQQRSDVVRKRDSWRASQAGMTLERLVFVDETWTKTNMTRAYGRSPKGQRLIGRVPYGHWKTTTFLAALRCDGITAPLVLDGPINGASFLAWTEQFLAPTLRPGDIVILDNLSSHKNDAVKAAINARKAELRFLPPYSPDLNPIEMVFAKLKALLRKVKRRSVETLWQETGKCLNQFPPEECKNYLRHAGYWAT